MIFELIWRPVFTMLFLAEFILPQKYHVSGNIEILDNNAYELDAHELGWIEECEGDSMTSRPVRLRLNCYDMGHNAFNCYYVRIHLGEWIAGSPKRRSFTCP